MELLDLCDDKVSLGEEGADLELVRVGALAEDAAGEVNCRDLENGELGGADVDAPAFGLDLYDAADDEVAYLGGVAGAEGPDGEELVCAGYGACDGGDDVCCVLGDVGSVASVFAVMSVVGFLFYTFFPQLPMDTVWGDDEPHPLGVVSDDLTRGDDLVVVAAGAFRGAHGDVALNVGAAI